MRVNNSKTVINGNSRRSHSVQSESVESVQYMTVAQAAVTLRTFEAYVYSLVRAGKLPGKRVRGRILLDRKAVVAYQKAMDQRRGLEDAAGERQSA